MRPSLTSILTVASLAVASVALALAAGQDAPPVRSVTSLDAQRYAGTWYELARLLNSFQAKLPTWLRWMPVGRGDYWVVMLDPDYRYAVVSEPSREYLWILSRTPQLDGGTYDGIVARLRADGYPVNRLVQTPQGATAPQVARNVPLI